MRRVGIESTIPRRQCLRLRSHCDRRTLIRVANNPTEVRTNENIVGTTTPTSLIRSVSFHTENVSRIPFIMVINIKVYILNRILFKEVDIGTSCGRHPSSGHHARYLLVYNSLPGGQSQRVKHTQGWVGIATDTEK